MANTQDENYIIARLEYGYAYEDIDGIRRWTKNTDLFSGTLGHLKDSILEFYKKFKGYCDDDDTYSDQGSLPFGIDCRMLYYAGVENSVLTQEVKTLIEATEIETLRVRQANYLKKQAEKEALEKQARFS